MRIGRRGSRSTQTPAGSVKSMKGRKRTTPSAATSNAVASRIRSATSGSPSWETCVPNWLIVSADQSLRKAGCRQSPPVGQTLRAVVVTSPREHAGRAEKREGESVRVAGRVVGPLEVGDQAVQPLLEADEVLLGEPDVQERGLVVLRPVGERLVGCLLEHHRPERPQLLRQRLVAAEHEEPGDPPVVLLRERPDLSPTAARDQARR